MLYRDTREFPLQNKTPDLGPLRSWLRGEAGEEALRGWLEGMWGECG